MSDDKKWEEYLKRKKESKKHYQARKNKNVIDWLVSIWIYTFL